MIDNNFKQRQQYIRDNKRYWSKHLIMDRLRALGIMCTWNNVVKVIYPKDKPNKNLEIVSAIEDVIKLGRQVLEPNPIGLKSRRDLYVEMKTEEVNFILNNQPIQL